MAYLLFYIMANFPFINGLGSKNAGHRAFWLPKHSLHILLGPEENVIQATERLWFSNLAFSCMIPKHRRANYISWSAEADECFNSG